MTLALMTVVLTGLLALAPELLRLWLGADFAAQATRPARILLCAMAANAAGLIPGAVLRAIHQPARVPTLGWAYCEHQGAQGDAFCRTQPLPPWLEPFCAGEGSVEAVEAPEACSRSVATVAASHEQRVCVQVRQGTRYPGVL